MRKFFSCCVLFMSLPGISQAQAAAQAATVNLHVGYGGYEEAGLVGVSFTLPLGAGLRIGPLGVLGLGRPRLSLVGPVLSWVPWHTRFRPYLMAGPLWIRRETHAPAPFDGSDHLGGLVAIGLETPLRIANRQTVPFAEVQALGGGGSWVQVMGGIRLVLAP